MFIKNDVEKLNKPSFAKFYTFTVLALPLSNFNSYGGGRSAF